MFFYVTGASFERIEQPHLAKALEILRPDVKLPNQRNLTDNLLDECYREMKTTIDKKLTEDEIQLWITSDSWTNISHDAIVNYMATCNRFSLFLESIATGEISHTGEWIASEFIRIINKLKTEVCGGCTDNTSAN